MVTRTQALVLGFFLVVWVSLLVILVAAPDVYDQALSLPGGRGTELAFLAALSGLIGLLVVGVVRRWRWTFRLILVAFLFGVLRIWSPGLCRGRPLHFHLPGAQPPGWAPNSGANGRASNTTDTDAILPSRTWYHSQVREPGTGAVLSS